MKIKSLILLTFVSGCNCGRTQGTPTKYAPVDAGFDCSLTPQEQAKFDFYKTFATDIQAEYDGQVSCDKWEYPELPKFDLFDFKCEKLSKGYYRICECDEDCKEWCYLPRTVDGTCTYGWYTSLMRPDVLGR